jgi:uncharacterized protein (DUF983 family)
MKKRTIKNRKTKKQKRVHKKQRGGGPKCPNCGSTNTYCTSRIQATYHCNACGNEFINSY